MNKPLHLTISVAIAITAMIAMNPTAQAADIDACQLVSADQAGKVLGDTIAVHDMSSVEADSSMCRYSGSRVNSGFMLIVGHVDYTSAKDEVARQETTMLSDTPPFLPKPSFSDVTGLGDAAFLSKASGYFQLHVLSHGNSIVVNINKDVTPQSEDQARQIAQLALKNIH